MSQKCTAGNRKVSEKVKFVQKAARPLYFAPRLFHALLSLANRSKLVASQNFKMRVKVVEMVSSSFY
jgi:hypothetical protein